MTRENNIEWLTGQDVVTVSLSQKRYITKIKALAEVHSSVDYTENEDGSIFAHVPLSFIKISAPRQMSDEQKAAAAERLRKMREGQS